MKTNVILILLALALLTGSAASQTLVARINCGSFGVSTAIGSFDADLPFVAGTQDGFVGGTVTQVLSSFAGFVLIGGADNPIRQVYFSSRINWSAYRFNVANGDYIVRLYLAETQNQAAGLRSLGVSLEGTPLMTSVDLGGEHGLQYGCAYSAEVTVSDGVLDVTATPGPGGAPPVVEAPIIHGIEVWTAPAVYPGPAAPTGLVVKAGYHRNMIVWDWNTDATVTGHVVERADAAGGPYATLAVLPEGPPRYFDDSAVVGMTHHYRVSALDADGTQGPASGPLAAAAMDSSSSGLKVIELTIDPADLQKIGEEILIKPKDEVPATFKSGSTTLSVEVRHRGGSGRLISKKSWKIKFPPETPYEGRRDINLKADFIDESLLRERLTHAMHDQLGQPNSRIRHVHLKVNGEYLGVFVDVEQMDEQFLDARCRSTNTNMYKCNGNMGTPADPAQYPVLYDKKIDASPGHTDIIDLITFLNGPTSPTYWTELADRMDLDGFLTYTAVVGYTGDFDTVVHNYFLAHDLDLDRWEIYPYDADVDFGIIPALMNLHVLTGTTAGSPGFINQLRERVLDDPGMLWRYLEKLKEILVINGNNVTLDPIIDQFHNEIKLDAQADPFKFGWEDDTAFLAEPAMLKGYVTNRAPFVTAQIASLQPATPPTDVWINEVMAAHHTVLMDEAGEYEDYVELYNATGAPIDVGGMFLTDDLGVPTAWMIPLGTMIPAMGRIIIWCDTEPLDGPLHATFNLNAEGEELGLFDTDGTTLLDFIAWRPQRNDMSYGRYNDGKQFFMYMPTPTPGTANTTAGNHPPTIGNVDEMPNTPDSTDSVLITCLAEDSDGLTAVDLFWRANGGSFTQVAMTPIPGDHWEATIPPHPPSTLVEYYVAATDTLSATAYKPKDAILHGDYRSFKVANTFPGALRFSEIMAKNNTTEADEAGQFEDWVEIENQTTIAINIGGFYLTDDLDVPTKWEIPAGTIIPAGGHIRIWCDNDLLDGPLHANFKLKASGEQVGLFFSDGMILFDGYSFGQQYADVGFGTVSPESAQRYLLFNPTPGADNTPAPGTTCEYEFEDPLRNLVQLTTIVPFSLGNPAHMRVNAVLPGETGCLIFDGDPGLTDNGLAGVTLISNLSVIDFNLTANAIGIADWMINVPNIPSLAGYVAHVQAFFTTSGWSNGVVAVMGP